MPISWPARTILLGRDPKLKAGNRIMWIKLKTGEHEQDRLQRLRSLLLEKLDGSRFIARVLVDYHERFGYALRIERVRRWRSSHYCGQHPNECLNLFPRTQKKGRLLEGADWVAFNDGLNDLLDWLGEAADVWSYNREARGNRFYLRQGRKRRLSYSSEEVWQGARFLGYAWSDSREDAYEDWCGRVGAPRSKYPDGTPGTASWNIEDEVEHEDHHVQAV